jgi:integrase/recombinase XerD
MSTGHTTMQEQALCYLEERRQLGFELDRSGSQTLAFARFADAIGHVGPLTSALVLRWAKDCALRADPFSWATRVNTLRPFACYLMDIDPQSDFPSGAPFGYSRRRLAPHIYTQQEIAALLDAARCLKSASGLAPVTYVTLFGLLASTGLRISEALNLRCGDLDSHQTCLTIRQPKFNRTRLVPLHPTATEALRAYFAVRAIYGSMDKAAPLFVSDRTFSVLPYMTVRRVFGRISAELGFAPRGGHKLLRIHDLRHTFICLRLMIWQESGVSIGNAMMALSTYVGHVNLADTYWYLQAVPELMATAGNRFETHSSAKGWNDHA